MDEKELTIKVCDIEERIKDAQFFNNAIIYVVGIIFAAATIYAGISLQSEKENLQNFKNEIKAEIKEMLGRTKKEPKISCLSKSRIPLPGATLPAKIEGKNLKFSFIVKNTGKGTGEFIKTMLYSKEPLEIATTKGTDLEGYDYMSIVGANEIAEETIPAGYAKVINSTINVTSNIEKTKGLHPVLLKVFYGGEKPEIINFKLSIE